MTKRTPSRYRWYISHELLYFDLHGSNDEGGDLEVWENSILLKARNSEEAYKKAMALGRASDQPVRVDGKECRVRFKGLRELVEIYDPLEDGAELEWCKLRMTKEQLSRAVPRKRQLHAFRVTWRPRRR